MSKIKVYYGRYLSNEGERPWTLKMHPQAEIEALEGGSGRVELLPKTEIEVDESELDEDRRYHAPIPEGFMATFIWCGLPNEELVEQDVEVSGKPIPCCGEPIERGNRQGIVRKVEIFGDQKKVIITADPPAGA